MLLLRSSGQVDQSLLLILILVIGFSLSGCVPSPEDQQQTPRPTVNAVDTERAPNTNEEESPRLGIKAPTETAPVNVALAAPKIHETTNPETATPSETKPVEFKTEIVAAFEKLVNPTDSIEEWEKANQELLEFGQEAIPLLADKLKNGNEIERETAASAIVALGSDAKAALPELRLALKDVLPFVQVNAAVALIQFPDEHKKAIPALVALLEHSDESVRQMATMNLAILGTEASNHVADLTRMLEKSDGPDLLLPVVELLGRIGPAAEDAVPKLKQIAFEQKGEISAAANSAIKLIQSQPE